MKQNQRGGREKKEVRVNKGEEKKKEESYTIQNTKKAYIRCGEGGGVF